MARFKLGETVTARPNGGEPITGNNNRHIG